MLILAGCQGYKPPKYKSPGEDSEGSDVGADSGAEDVDINLDDLDDETGDSDTEASTSDNSDNADDSDYQASTDTYEPEPYVPPAATVEENNNDNNYDDSYGSNDNYNTYQSEETNTDNTEKFQKAPYRRLDEGDSSDDMPTITVTEGEVVKVKVKANDLDGDSLTYQYTAPLNSQGEWRTRYGDAGVYTSKITVSDGKTSVVKEVRIVVEPENNKPELEVSNVTVNEGEVVTLNPRTYDADGDRLTVSYSGWMTSQSKQTGYDDAGVHTVTVSVTDGISVVSKDVTVTVNDVNRPPEVEIEV